MNDKEINSVGKYMWQLVVAVSVLASAIGYMYRDSISFRDKILTDERIRTIAIELKVEKKDSLLLIYAEKYGYKKALDTLNKQ
jgi:ribonuclease HIII